MTAGDFSLRLLDENHYPNFFDCGYGNALGEWLNNKALQYQEREQSRIWVLGKSDDCSSVCGYFTLSSYQIVGTEIPRKQRDGIPEGASHPAQLLGKFALDQGYQGTGLSTVLMFHVMKTYLKVAEYTGTRYLALHAQNERLEKYYKERGFDTFSRITTTNGDTHPLMAMTTDRVRQTLTSSQ